MRPGAFSQARALRATCRARSWQPGIWRRPTIFTPEDRADGAPDKETRTALGAGQSDDLRTHVRKDGGEFRGNGSLSVMRDEAGEVFGFVKILRDLTPRK